MEDLEKKDLKIQALLEKVSSLTTNYENQVADLRVALTELEQTANNMIAERDERIRDLESRIEENAVSTEGNVVQGEVERVSDETDSDEDS